MKRGKEVGEDGLFRLVNDSQLHPTPMWAVVLISKSLNGEEDRKGHDKVSPHNPAIVTCSPLISNSYFLSSSPWAWLHASYLISPFMVYLHHVCCYIHSESLFFLPFYYLTSNLLPCYKLSYKDFVQNSIGRSMLRAYLTFIHLRQYLPRYIKNPNRSIFNLILDMIY